MANPNEGWTSPAASPRASVSSSSPSAVSGGYGTQSTSRFAGGACSGIETDVRYLVHAGDTLSSVARSCSISVADLLRLNAAQFPDGVPKGAEDEEGELYVGQALVVDERPAAPPSPFSPGSTAAAAAAAAAVGKGGRSRSSSAPHAVAGTAGTAEAAFAAASLADEPPSAKATMAASQSQSRMTEEVVRAWLPPPPAEVDDVDCSTHVVQRGQSLAHIAEAHGVTVSALRGANRRYFPLGDMGRLEPGMCLALPPPDAAALQAPEGFYVMRTCAGDTLTAVAKRHGMTLEELRRMSRLPSFVGGRTPVVAGRPLVARLCAQDSSRARPGDTLLTISARLGVSLADVRAENGVPEYMAGCTIVREGTLFRVRRRGDGGGSGGGGGGGGDVGGGGGAGGAAAAVCDAGGGSYAGGGLAAVAQQHAADAAAPPPKPHMVTVQASDTVRGLMEMHGIKESQIRAWNRDHFPLGDIGGLRVGKTLIVRKL